MGHLRWTAADLVEIKKLEDFSSSLEYRLTQEAANEVLRSRFSTIMKPTDALEFFPIHYREEFYRAAESVLRFTANRKAVDKVKDLTELHLEARALRSRGKRIVLAHGCFDWLHLGHLRHLEEARAQGDALFVTVTGNAFVKKGPERPIFDGLQRAEMLASLACVDWVAVNESSTALPVVRQLKPDVFAKGREYREAMDDASLAEKAQIEANGGQVYYTDQIVYSSSKLIRMTRGEHV